MLRIHRIIRIKLMRRLAGLAIPLIFAAFPALALAWGAQGHEQVGAIADKLIAGSPAEKWVAHLLGGMNLQTASVWADCAKAVKSNDDINFTYQANPRRTECAPFSGPEAARQFESFVARNWKQCGSAHGSEYCGNQYHYADISVLHDHYAPGYVGANNHDIVHAIDAAIAVLRGRAPDAPFSIADRQEALLLLAHYVGDIHQPLHVAALYLDADGRIIDPEPLGYQPGHDTAGGNNIIDGKKSLHAEWDAIPPALEIGGEQDAALLQLAKSIPPTPGDLSAWSTAWATDSIRASRPVFADLQFSMRTGMETIDKNNNKNADRPERWDVTGVDAAYQSRADRIKFQQLAKAGARLAQVLKAVWPDGS
ncbi:MAG: S1/P1 nuclease, partial [Burkholderiales bacterium]